MSPQGRILIVDDDPQFVDAYRTLLRDDGYEVDAVGTEAEARRRFAEPGWSVILVDQKLRGPGGPNAGLDLAADAALKAPGAKVIIATAYAEPAAIERAFELGVYDYLQKDQFFVHFLRAKVRNAMETWRARARAAQTAAERQEKIVETWKRAREEKNAQTKGALLETLMELLFSSIQGFEYVRSNRQNELEEIDVLVQNNSTDPFWQKEGSYLLIECKNWSSKVGVNELSLFQQKVERRYDRSKLGFFVAMSGYAETTKIEEWTRRGGNSLVVLLQSEDLETLVQSHDRNATLKEFHARAVVAGKG